MYLKTAAEYVVFSDKGQTNKDPQITIIRHICSKEEHIVKHVYL